MNARSIHRMFIVQRVQWFPRCPVIPVLEIALGVADSVANFLESIELLERRALFNAVVVSIAYRKRILLHFSGPSCSSIALMFHTLGFFSLALVKKF